MINFVTKGCGRKLVFHENFKDKKKENLKLLSKTHVIYFKRKLRNVEFKFRMKKYDS